MKKSNWLVEKLSTSDEKEPHLCASEREYGYFASDLRLSSHFATISLRKRDVFHVWAEIGASCFRIALCNSEPGIWVRKIWELTFAFSFETRISGENEGSREVNLSQFVH